MKRNRFGRAKILTLDEFSQLMYEGFPEGSTTTARNRALFAVCFFTACRIQEAVTLHYKDVFSGPGRVHNVLLIRKSNTKGKLRSRELPIGDELRTFLLAYNPKPSLYLFPNQEGSFLSKDYASVLLRRACRRIGLEGVSTHSFRRTALTTLSNQGVPLRVIQEISGHTNLEQLYAYLEVRDDQVRGAIAGLSMMSPVPHHKKIEERISEERFPDDAETKNRPF